MSMLIAWIVMAIIAIGLAVTITYLIRKPMRRMLGANSYIAPAQGFYVRTFTLAASLVALATIAGRSMPCPDQRKSMKAMEYVWWVMDGWEPLFWGIALFLIGYVVLLTIVFAVLGRYHD